MSFHRKEDFMTSPVLSVFIPVYNAENYLKRCLDSVLNQTLRELEVYLYDDGSRDGSYAICQSYAQADSRIHLSRGENGNSVYRMNDFLRDAGGTYLGFVDNDDYLDPDYFENMIRMLEEKGADCVISSFTPVDSGENALAWYAPELEDGLVLSREAVLKRFLTTLEIEGFRWNKIYPKSIFTDNHFQFRKLYPADINGEFELLTYVNKAVLLNHHGYYYRQSATSDVGRMTTKKTISFLQTFARIEKLAAAQGLEEAGDFYRTWRSINTLFNTWKSRERLDPEDWKALRRDYGWKAVIGKPLPRALATVLKYKNGKEKPWKFFIKTLVVRYCYR